MGKHEKSRRRSLLRTLSEAEHHHYLDCPDAPIRSRAAALLLDLILWLLALTAIHFTLETVRQLAPSFLGQSPSVEQITSWNTNLYYGSLGLKVLFTFCYFVWMAVLFGGTPAKLLLGVRVLDKEDGRKLSLFRTMWRELLKLFVLAGGFVLYVIGREFLHDRLVGSVVKKVHVTP